MFCYARLTKIFVQNNPTPAVKTLQRYFTGEASCKLLVVGGGSGGCTMAAKFCKKFGQDQSVIVLEPSSDHYYQPLFTLVGAGVTNLKETHRHEGSVLPKKACWVQDRAVKISPDQCKVTTQCGGTINYEYLIVAVGMENNYDAIPGLLQGLNDGQSGVCTIYDPKYAEHVFESLSRVRKGDAIFTFPMGPIKCPGAPQKIVYLADALFRRSNIRNNIRISYNTSMPVIFGVKKYADSLMKIAQKKDICVQYKTTLTEVRPEKKEAVFQVADGDNNRDVTFLYDVLHVTPPMRSLEVIRTNKQLADAAGYLDVDKFTLQHKKYSNVFGLGDCTNTPNSKTAAAIAKQSYVLEQNLMAVVRKNEPKSNYDGYGACPLVTSFNTCVLAEFLYDGVVHETFPWNQAEESKISYMMKRHLFPFIYWNFMLKGNYNGPEFVRRIINPIGK